MKIKKILLPVLVFFLVYACIKDDSDERDSLDVVMVKAWVASHIDANALSFISKKEIKWDWEGAESTTNSFVVHSLESKDIRSFYKLEVSALDGYEAVIYMYNPTAPSIDGSFTGREIAFGLDGEIIYSKLLQGTEGTQKSIPKRGLLATAARFSEGNNCGGDVWCWDDDLAAWTLDEVVVTFNQGSLNTSNAYSSISWSSVSSYMNSNPSSSNYYGSLLTTYTSGTYVVSSTLNVTNNLTGNPNCAYGKLVSANGDLFKQTIGAFIDDPEYNLSLEIGICSTTDDACTDVSDVNNITITIEDINSHILQLAQHILHEGIHAELARYVNRKTNGSIDLSNRPRLFQLYKHYKELELGYSTGDIQHIYMTEKYINPIATALRQIDGNKYNLDYYKAFAWDGLRVWDANNLLNMEMNSNYENYRNIVLNNSTISCN